MFWKRKPKCPITLDDKSWIEEQLSWIDTNIVSLVKQPTVLPTKEFINTNFSGNEDDAYATLEILSTYFQINPTHINLKFYDENVVELVRGTITQQDGNSSSGMYLQEDDSNTIFIEKGQLKSPGSLIATLAHELSHYIIMHQNGYYFEDYENELITDLTAIGYGFGIFLGNTKFSFNQWQSGDGWGGWSSFDQGYLPQQVIAYALTQIQNIKNDMHPNWIDYLSKDFRLDFNKSLSYINYIRSL